MNSFSYYLMAVPQVRIPILTPEQQLKSSIESLLQ